MLLKQNGVSSRGIIQTIMEPQVEDWVEEEIEKELEKISLEDLEGSDEEEAKENIESNSNLRSEV